MGDKLYFKEGQNCLFLCQLVCEAMTLENILIKRKYIFCFLRIRLKLNAVWQQRVKALDMTV